MFESSRAERRRETGRVIRRRLRRYGDECAFFNGWMNVSVESPDPDRAHYYACHYRRHHCGKRRHGRPKVGYGACRNYTRDAVDARVLSRRLERELTAGRIRPDEVLPPRGFYGHVETVRAAWRFPGSRVPT